MVIVLKNENLFYIYQDNIYPIEIPNGTITWNYWFDIAIFALEDRIIVRNLDDKNCEKEDYEREIMMDNKGIISIYYDFIDYGYMETIIRFFPDKIVTTMEDKEYIIPSTIGKKLLNLINLDSRGLLSELSFVLEDKNYVIWGNSIDISDFHYSRHNLLWENDELGVKFYSHGNPNNNVYLLGYNGSVTEFTYKLKKELLQDVISNTCILYNGKKIVFYKNIPTLLLDNEEQYKFLKPGYNTKSARK